MHRLMSTAAVFLILSASANGAPRVRAARLVSHGAAVYVQGFYRIDHFYDWPGFYHQYPNTLFGYPNYNWSYFPLYYDYPGCDFVWSRPTTSHKNVQRGTWSCS